MLPLNHGRTCMFNQGENSEYAIHYYCTCDETMRPLSIFQSHISGREKSITLLRKFPRAAPQQYKCCDLERKRLWHWTATSPSGWTFTGRSRLLLPRLQQLSCSTGTPRIMKETSLHLCHPDISWLQTRIASLGRPNMTSILMQSVRMQVRRWVMWWNLII